ncbi:UDP-N-acetylmuramate dehydrogenase [Anaerovorax odorimutans]|uniref:UDP-N-acetylmuramate dehydrogenase n=1 Tax=Anaerovorax odorimutans TaxID=109327 RepID=UPI0003FC9AB5|nr:UDP-N-acetylmuramate dehydrogenase [Anaerovorax odorimutans]
MNKSAIYNTLIEVIDKESILQNVDMGQFTSFKAGGYADFLISPSNNNELAGTLKILKEQNCEYFLMGNGSNFLVRDGGYRGAIVRIGKNFDKISVEGDILTAGSGTLLSSIAKEAMENSLTGFEFAGGIPGSLGGAVVMNAGAYDGEIKNVLIHVNAMDKEGVIHKLNDRELKLGYRHSIFQENGWIVLEATLQLSHGDKDKIKEKMLKFNKLRNEKQPLNYPSGGSFFKRPEGYFAGKLVQDAKLKGLSLGGAQVSELHSGFIINKGGATATDIINLMVIVQNTVWDKFGVMLEPEVRIIGER